MEEQQTEVQSSGSKAPMLAIVGIIIVVVVAVAGYQMMNKGTNQSSNTTAVTGQPTQEAAQQPTSAQKSAYKDGSYTAVGAYTSPGGTEELGVTLTLANGVVTDSKVEVKATRPISKTRQEDFAAHYKDMVVGKNIADLELGKVSGSSLSPKGFNDAVTKIKQEAGAQS